MASQEKPKIAIVDYGVGNLYSIRRACVTCGMDAAITSNVQEILNASAVILPGVGAFGDAMDELKRLDLVSPLRELAQQGTPLIGICLGMQLLMSESYEFGHHRGLGIVDGEVVRFENIQQADRVCKVPHVGWNRIHRAPYAGSTQLEPFDPWQDSPLEPVREGEFMYFVHSYYVQPSDPAVTLSVSHYAEREFCSGLKAGNVVAFQFHPERSGPQGLEVYRWIASRLFCTVSKEGNRNVARRT